MDRKRILEQTEETVRRRTAGESTGHDWWHAVRVRHLALRIAREEQADEFVVQLAALLHDLGDFKFHGGDESEAPRQARQWLEEQGIEEGVIAQVCEIVAGVSFKGAGVPTPMRSIEGQAVQDADRLDALGAIGVARAFAFGGNRGRELHNPERPAEPHATFEQYKQTQGPTINHFYEKLLLLKDRMNTQTGRRLAEARHQFMEDFLDRFFQEWDGKA